MGFHDSKSNVNILNHCLSLSHTTAHHSETIRQQKIMVIPFWNRLRKSLISSESNSSIGSIRYFLPSAKIPMLISSEESSKPMSLSSWEFWSSSATANVIPLKSLAIAAIFVLHSCVAGITPKRETINHKRKLALLYKK